jgi:penicillin-binding protein 1A
VKPPPDLRPHNYFTEEVQNAILNDPRIAPTLQARRNLLLEGGLKIVSTMDVAAQFHAQQAVNRVLPQQPPFTAALVAMDPQTGAVRALVGGPGFDQFQYDLATHEPGRQAGSTYKVITLAAALEQGYSPNDTVDGSSPCTAQRPPYPDWITSNAEPGGGTETLRTATENSVNCAFAHLIASMGPQYVVDMAHRLGITQNVPAYLSITLGTNETTPIEMATVASTLADRGVKHPPQFVLKVTTPGGRVLVDNTQAQGQSVVSSDIVDCETDMLRGVVQRGTGTAAQIGGVDIAGKTGTTDQKTDAWFLGYTPHFAAVVWMGAPQAQVPMHDVGGIEVFGGTYPARIWNAFAGAELAGVAPDPFPPAGPVCDRPGETIDNSGRYVPAPRIERPPPAPATPGANPADGAHDKLAPKATPTT